MGKNFKWLLITVALVVSFIWTYQTWTHQQESAPKDLIGRKYVLGQKSSIWDEYTPSLQALSDQNLETKYYNFFLAEGHLPIANYDMDLNGDGVTDKAFVSVGVGCASCHQSYIDLFVGNRVYSTTGSDSTLSPLENGNGFYLTSQQNQGDGGQITKSKFVWNGDGFSLER